MEWLLVVTHSNHPWLDNKTNLTLTVQFRGLLKIGRSIIICYSWMD